MGTIRSRNISIVPVLQSIAQIKAVFPQDKWEIFMDNCAAVIYLGSGPASYSTHKYISDLLGEMTIDTREDSQTTGVHGNASLQNRRLGRVLMTPAEVKRMSRKVCLIFLEGQYPIYDRKAIPFRTKAWLESQALALPEGYRHPVRVVYNPETLSYRTVTAKSRIQFLEKEDVEFYKTAAKQDETIKVFELDQEEFLYLNWRKQPMVTEEEMEAIFQQAKREKEQLRNGRAMDVPEDVLGVQEQKESRNGKETRTKEWDLSGSIFACIRRYSRELTEEQLDEIIMGLEQGLSEEEVKSYFCLPVEEMRWYRRIYQLEKQK